jgi:hypothetical protein
VAEAAATHWATSADMGVGVAGGAAGVTTGIGGKVENTTVPSVLTVTDLR